MTQEKRSPSKGGNGNGGAAGETRALGGKGHGMGLEAGIEALINHISRTTSLKGLSANEAFSAIA